MKVILMNLNLLRSKTEKKYNYFLNKTDEVFNNEFKGFEFNVGENNITFKPGEQVKSLKMSV